MNIVCLNKVDFSGNGYNLCEAINRLTAYHATNICMAESIFHYPSHVWLTDDNQKQVRRLIRNADAVLIREFYELPELYGQKLKKKQLTIMSMGGWRFRDVNWRNKTIDTLKAQRLKWMITSADFIKDFPEATFVPCCIDTDGLREKYLSPKAYPPLVMHSPSDPFHLTKSGQAFLDATQKLWKEGYDFDVEISMGEPNAKCLEKKGRASIFFDRLEYLYGMNSIEAATLGCAVLTYTSAETLQNLSAHAGMRCPFIIVDNYNRLVANLEWLSQDEEKLEQIQKECHAYAEKLHNGEYSVKQFMGMIE